MGGGLLDDKTVSLLDTKRARYSRREDFVKLSVTQAKHKNKKSGWLSLGGEREKSQHQSNFKTELFQLNIMIACWSSHCYFLFVTKYNKPVAQIWTSDKTLWQGKYGVSSLKKSRNNGLLNLLCWQYHFFNFDICCSWLCNAVFTILCCCVTWSSPRGSIDNKFFLLVPALCFLWTAFVQFVFDRIVFARRWLFSYIYSLHLDK